MLSINIAFKAKNIVFMAIVITLLLSLRHNNVNKSKTAYLTEDFESGGAVFADVTVSLKVSLLYNANIDGFGHIDGRDLALSMYYFGKTESEYKSESFTLNPDLNGDKIVDGEDLVILAWRFGLKR